MANRYWVGGTATWDGTAGTKWALTSGGAGGQAVPTSADDVFFDANSGAVTVTIGTSRVAKSINCTGFTGTLGESSNTFNVYGSITLSAGMSYTHTGQVNFNSTGNLITAGKVFSTVFLLGTGITLTLGDALNTGSRNITVSGGTFTTAGFSVTCLSFATIGTVAKTLNFGSSTITISGGNGLNLTGTNTTLNAGTSQINLTSSTATLEGGGKTFYNVSFTATSEPFTCTINGSNTFSNLTVAAPTAGVITYEFSDNQTITTLVASGTSAIGRILFASSVLGTQRTLTVTTWSTRSDIDFRDIAFNSSRSGTRLGDCGGNTNITFSAPKTVYWNLAGSQNWSSTGWATSSGGAPAINNFPLPQDTAVFDDTGSAGTVTVDSQFHITTINASARTSAMTLTCAGSSAMTFYGNLVTGSGVTFSGTGTFGFSGRSPQTITSAGKTVTQVVVISSVGSTVTLQDAITLSVISAGTINLISGTFDLGGYNVTLSGGGFSANSTTARTLALGSSVFSVATSFNTSTSTNLTVTGSGTIRMAGAAQKAFSSGSASYSGITVDQAGAGLLTFNGVGTFGNISNSYASTGATSIRFDANQTVENFTASGQAGRVLTITSNLSGTARTLTKTSGIVGVNYLSIQDSTATGGATWYAGANSIDVSNNTGWIFTNAPSSSGSFIAFFM